MGSVVLGEDSPAGDGVWWAISTQGWRGQPHGMPLLQVYLPHG